MMGDLPEGWTFARLDQIGSWGSGGTPSRKEASFYERGHIPWFKIGDLNDWIVTESEERITEQGLQNSTARLIPPNVLLVAMYGASIGKLGVSGIECATNQAIAYCAPRTDLWFLYWALRWSRSALIERGKGGAQPNISQQVLRSFVIPLPPLAEQKRIAAKVQSLLDHVASVGSRITRASEGIRRFRQAILAAACSGQLTEDWRERQGIDTPWTETTVGEVTEAIQYGYTASASSVARGPKFLRITDIQGGRVEWDHVPSCTITSEEEAKYRLNEGDIVFARTGATTGKSFLIREVPRAVFASYLIRVRPSSSVLPSFLYLFFQTPEYWSQIVDRMSGNAQPGCNASKLAELTLLLPPLEEQAEIVHRVTAIFAVAEGVDLRLAAASHCVNGLEHSILTKAFSGELVPTEAEMARAEGRDYETADEFLARIQRSQQELPNGSNGQRSIKLARKRAPRLDALAVDD